MMSKTKYNDQEEQQEASYEEGYQTYKQYEHDMLTDKPSAYLRSAFTSD